MFTGNVGFKICLSCELIFGESCSLDNVGLNSFLSHKTNTVFNVAPSFGAINTVFVGSYLYDTACVVDHDSPIAKMKNDSNCQCQLLPSPMTVIFIFLLHLLESALHVLDRDKLYEYSIHGIDLNDCNTIIW